MLKKIVVFINLIKLNKINKSFWLNNKWKIINNLKILNNLKIKKKKVLIVNIINNNLIMLI